MTLLAQRLPFGLRVRNSVVRDLSVLSDVEFEELVADLFGLSSVRMSGAICPRPRRRCRSALEFGWDRWGIGQCKHYFRSTFPQLLTAAAKSELPHLHRQKPHRYRFVTSQDLTPGQKDKLIKALNPWLSGPGDVSGRR